MKKYLFIFLLYSIIVGQEKIDTLFHFTNASIKNNQLNKSGLIFNYDNSEVHFGNYLGYRNFPYHSHSRYIKINKSLLIDSNYSKFMYNRNFSYAEKYGKDLIDRINGPYNTGLRYFPLGNGIFNIDARNHINSRGISEGQSLGLGVLGLTKYNFYTKGNID